MKNQNSQLILSSLVLAISASVYGQEKAVLTPAATPAPETATPSAAASSTPSASTSAASAESKSFFSFKGTDLRIGSAPPITFHGFASQGFLASSTYNYLGNTTHGSFELSEFALNASMSPFPHTRVAIQGFAFDAGNVGRYSPALDYALVDYNVCNEFGIRAGRIRRPEGIYNAIQDIDLARTSILLPQGVYDARFRDFSGSVDGGSLYGDVGLGKVGSFSYEAYGGMTQLSEQGGIARLLQDSLPKPPIGSYGGVNGFPAAGAQLWWNTPISGLRAGASMLEAIGFEYDYTVNPPYGPGAIQNIGNIPIQHYSLEYQIKSWTFQAEYRSQNIIDHSEVAGNTISRARTHSDSWYAGASYRVNKWWEVGTYYTEDYADTSNRSGEGMAVPSDASQKDFALSFRFDPKPWWVIKLEGHAIKGTALLNDTANNPVRNNDWWLMVGVKTTFSF